MGRNECRMRRWRRKRMGWGEAEEKEVDDKEDRRRTRRWLGRRSKRRMRR